MSKISESSARPTAGRRTAARLVRDARRRAGLTQTEVARRAGLPIQTVHRIEHDLVDPKLGTVEAVLGVCGWWLRKEPRAGGDRTEIRELLSVPTLARLAGRERPARPPCSWASRATRTLQVLASRGVPFIVDGPMAERLHGAPVPVPDVRIRTLAGADGARRLRRALEITDRRFLRVAVTSTSCRSEEFARLEAEAWWLDLPAGGSAPVVCLDDLVAAAGADGKELLVRVREERALRSL